MSNKAQTGTIANKSARNQLHALTKTRTPDRAEPLVEKIHLETDAVVAYSYQLFGDEEERLKNLVAMHNEWCDEARRPEWSRADPVIIRQVWERACDEWTKPGRGRRRLSPSRGRHATERVQDFLKMLRSGKGDRHLLHTDLLDQEHPMYLKVKLTMADVQRMEPKRVEPTGEIPRLEDTQFIVNMDGR